jgi:hypothetical protein
MDIKIIDPPSKPKISYDDILSSLQMTLVNGKLQISRGDILEKNTVLRDQFDTSKPINKVIANPVLYQQKLQQQQQQNFYNPPPQPLTEEERKQQILAYIHAHNTRVLLAKRQVKSKKLLFTS